MGRREDVLVPARFLLTIGHLVVVILAYSSAPGNVAAGLPASTLPSAGAQREWKIRQPNGNAYVCKELTTLQKWIIEGKVGRDDEISLSGETWKRLGNIPELASFFQVVEDAAKARAFDALRACLPAGTVSGAPKIRAMQIIDELEPVRRGPYAGAVGYIDFGGSMDTCIALRTIVVTGGKAYVQSGAGIVADSVPESEFEETLNKAKGLLVSIEMTTDRLRRDAVANRR